MIFENVECGLEVPKNWQDKRIGKNCQRRAGKEGATALLHRTAQAKEAEKSRRGREVATAPDPFSPPPDRRGEGPLTATSPPARGRAVGRRILESVKFSSNSGKFRQASPATLGREGSSRSAY